MASENFQFPATSHFKVDPMNHIKGHGLWIHDGLIPISLRPKFKFKFKSQSQINIRDHIEICTLVHCAVVLAST